MASVGASRSGPSRTDRLADLPFWGVHVAAIVGAVWVGWSWAACWWLIGGYAVRMFAITAGLHRYFSHRSFKTSRAFQFVLGVLGMTAVQQGPLWWAAHHRNHHKHSDEPQDIHSPVQHGFYRSHIGWIFDARRHGTDFERIKDFAKYPELRFLNRFDTAFVVAIAVLTLIIGGTTALAWGFFVATVVSWHATFAINSLAHVWGRRRYTTSDDSRNNVVLAVLTFGEGWHNNHHHYQRAARQGFFWWELDVTYYVLKLLEAFRIVWDVAGVPRHVLDGRGAVAPDPVPIAPPVPVAATPSV
ncbi:MAG: acyl-CoA desaturase [Kofleriaceae bacterium]